VVDAQRPVILAGGGTINADATSELVSLAEFLGAPVVTSLHGKGAIPDDHPLAGRTCGSKGTTCANEAVRHADVVLAVGTRFGEWDTSSWHPGDPFDFTSTRLIHLDIDDRELGKNYPTEVALWGDAKAGLADLLAAIADLTPPREWQTLPWVEQLETWRRDWFGRLDARALEVGPMSTTRALRERAPCHATRSCSVRPGMLRAKCSPSGTPSPHGPT
jgi:acetolactate synthase-1/2/3 large subunit